MSEEELFAAAKNHQAPYELIKMVAKAGKLPVPNFSAGGIATPADASLMMQLGAEAVFVGSGIFMKGGIYGAGSATIKAERAEAEARARAIVIATTHYKIAKVLAEVSEQVRGDEGPRRVGASRRRICCRRGMVGSEHLALSFSSGATSFAPDFVWTPVLTLDCSASGCVMAMFRQLTYMGNRRSRQTGADAAAT